MTTEYFSSINDVSKRLEIPAHTLRYWEKQFPVAVKPTTGAGGRRYYRPETVTSLETIKDLLYNHGMTIAGVKKLLKDGCFPEKIDGFAPGSEKNIPAPKPVQKPSQDTGFFAPISDVPQVIDLLERARAILA